MKKRISAVILSLIIMLSLAVPALAASEQDTAEAYLTEHGIYQGDQNGNLNLNSGLTRAELAAILTRLDFMDAPEDWGIWGAARFSDPATRCNPFTDIPGWALPYIEYCYQRGLMKGVSETSFDPQGKVNPQMACTVILRYCGIAETGWSYETSVSKAQSLGIAPGDGLSGAEVLRGTMAVILHRGIMYDDADAAPTDPPQAQTEPQENPQAPKEQASSMTIEEMKLEIVRLTNEERVKAGLSELTILPELMDCAQAKAQDFLDNHYYGHISPTFGTPSKMIQRYVPNAKGYGENLKALIAWTGTTQEAFEGWIESQEHLQTMLNSKYTHIGIGIVFDENGGQRWVQQFCTL